MDINLHALATLNIFWFNQNFIHPNPKVSNYHRNKKHAYTPALAFKTIENADFRTLYKFRIGPHNPEIFNFEDKMYKIGI